MCDTGYIEDTTKVIQTDNIMVENSNESSGVSAMELFILISKSQLESLKTQLTEEKSKLKESVENSNVNIAHLKAEHRNQIDQLSKRYEDATREKESMVLKYAQGEKRNLEISKKVRELELKLKDQKSLMDNTVEEKEKLGKELKSRISDFSSYEMELKNLKASITIAEQKIRNEEAKYKDEVEKSKDIKKKYEELQRNVFVIKEENNTLRMNCQEIVKTYQNSEEMRSNSLSNSVKQLKDSLTKSEEDRKDAVDNFNKISTELQAVKIINNNQLQELKTVKEKLKHSEADRMCQEENVKQLKDTIKSLTYVKDELNDRLNHLEPLENEVLRLNEDNNRLQSLINESKQIYEENEVELQFLRQKELELSKFIETLSDNYAELQIMKESMKNENDRLQQQTDKCERKIKELLIKINFWEDKFKSESKLWNEEKNMLNAEISKLKNEINLMNQKLLDANDQIYSLQKKHKAHIKDLTRQLLKSRSEESPKHSSETHKSKYETDIPKSVKSSSLSDDSRDSVMFSNEKDECTDSNLNYVSSSNGKNLNLKFNGNSISHPSESNRGPSINLNQQTPEIHMIEPQNNVLIDKIIKLQRKNARSQEKIDFLTEHTNQLTQEIQKKTVLLRYLFCQNEDKESIKSEIMEKNHIMMSKKGGIMASVFSSRPVDERMTLDLSLEINHKLQSVLEDTTVKNITLKDSISTLGEEISKLTDENRSLKKQLQS